MFDTDFDPGVGTGEVIPSGLDEMEPGPVLAALLSSIDVSTVSGYDQIVVLRAHRRMVSHYQAHTYTDMVSVTDSLSEVHDDPRNATESAAAEIRAALNLTRRAADIELSFAMDLRQRLPQVSDMLSSGVIDVRRAKTIDDGTCHLPISAARNVVERIAEIAPQMTAGELGAHIRKLCIEADTEEAKKRYEHAVTDRKIIAEPTVDGTANLIGLDLPPDMVAAVTKRINKIARSLRGNHESRTMDQLRADVYLDLLGGSRHKTRSKGVIHMTADLDTLVGLTDHAGELNGYGPVIADIARQVADEQPDAELRYTITDTETGEPIHAGTTRRRPSASQRRKVETRDSICVFPGCRMPAADCDLDHGTTYAEGGPTVPGNLAPLCRNDHRIKHNGWNLKRLAIGGYQWTSPLGHTYTTRRAPP
ncbi:MAG: HNH endonuclease signature motif containing protein [Acidimicrobiia bacterium]|nr:MAG: HNH endonuclease signature motif containing protein [Acidimicrobiia bacterium]